MSWNFKDMVGQKYGKLTIIERAENDKHGNACWRCRCSCGAEVTVVGQSLRKGNTKSCGCLHDEGNRTTHGMKHSKIYKTWRGIKSRCYNPNNKSFKNYGGRGITMYEPWINDFQAFFAYVSTLEHYGEDGYTLDREDNDGNYEPGNLRWADRKTQSRNRRGRRIVEYNGEKMTLAEAAEKSGINYDTLLMRYRAGDYERGRLFRPVRGDRND